MTSNVVGVAVGRGSNSIAYYDGTTWTASPNILHMELHAMEIDGLQLEILQQMAVQLHIRMTVFRGRQFKIQN